MEWLTILAGASKSSSTCTRKSGITTSGHETLDTDPGVATSKGDYSLETYLLGTDHYQIELLANLDQVPEAGAVVVVHVPEAERLDRDSRTRVLPFAVNISASRRDVSTDSLYPLRLFVGEGRSLLLGKKEPTPARRPFLLAKTAASFAEAHPGRRSWDRAMCRSRRRR